ncbi:MAG: sulfite exporter TauE/SafE family protein [Mycobacterium leprae]
MHQLVSLAQQWYAVMSQLSSRAGAPLQQLLNSQNLPAISALLLGVLGGLAPCQVTANASAIAYVSQKGSERRSLWGTVGWFIAGKATVYLLLGFLAAMLGLRIPGPVLGFMRKFTGPLMLMVGLYLIGLFRLTGAAGAKLADWLREHAPRRGHPAYWLGVAFSLGFCPTMAMLFFGALVPLVVESQAGLVLPLFFAAGTAMPVILWALAMTAGRPVAAHWMRRVRSLDRYVRWAAAAVFILAGLNDTLLYWAV